MFSLYAHFIVQSLLPGELLVCEIRASHALLTFKMSVWVTWTSVNIMCSLISDCLEGLSYEQARNVRPTRSNKTHLSQSLFSTGF